MVDWNRHAILAGGEIYSTARQTAGPLHQRHIVPNSADHAFTFLVADFPEPASLVQGKAVSVNCGVATPCEKWYRFSNCRSGFS